MKAQNLSIGSLVPQEAWAPRTEALSTSGPHFLARNLVKCGVCHVKSVCLSVTLMGHALTVQDVEICFASHHTIDTFLVAGDQICNTELRTYGRNDCVKQRHPLATTKIGSIVHHISGRCQIGCTVQTTSNIYMQF